MTILYSGLEYRLLNPLSGLNNLQELDLIHRGARWGKSETSLLQCIITTVYSGLRSHRDSYHRWTLSRIAKLHTDPQNRCARVARGCIEV